MENLNFIITTLIDLAITICFYEIIPLFLIYVLKKKYTEKEAKKIAIINTVAIFIIFTLIHVLVLEDDKLANPAPAFLWGSVAYFILKPKSNENNVYENNKSLAKKEPKKEKNNINIDNSNKLREYKSITIVLIVVLCILTFGIISLTIYSFNLKQQLILILNYL